MRSAMAPSRALEMASDVRPARDRPRCSRTELEHLAVQRPIANGLFGANSSSTGAVTRARERAHVLGREPQLRLRLQALIGVPLKAARHFAQRAAREHLGGRGA